MVKRKRFFCWPKKRKKAECVDLTDVRLNNMHSTPQPTFAHTADIFPCKRTRNIRFQEQQREENNTGNLALTDSPPGRYTSLAASFGHNRSNADTLLQGQIEDGTLMAVIGGKDIPIVQEPEVHQVFRI